MKKDKRVTREKKKNLFAITTFSLLGLMILVTLSGVILYRMQLRTIDTAEEEEAYVAYDKYFALIANNDKADFWQDVYGGAKQSGETTGDYVEIFAQDMGIDYTLEERMDIAIASNVDGIIVEGEDSALLQEKIDKAYANNIPVVVVGADVTESERISFVGISRYELGQTYGQQTCELANLILQERKENGDNRTDLKVMVLISREEDKGQNLLVSGIREEIAQFYILNNRIELQTYPVDDLGSFAAEESIRDIFMGKEDAPDILICLSEIYTTCAYQAVIDYNKVGVTNIIGYYDSETILNGIDKEIIYSTVSMDAEQMGHYSATALSEYLDMGYASEYFTVDTYVINKDNVKQYLGGQDEQTQE